jgi:putative hemolysin
MSDGKLIDVRRIIKSKNPGLYKWIPGLLLRYLERILHQKEINSFLEEHKNEYDIDFCISVMKFLGTEVKINGLENIPRSGKIILVMNHPLGGMDAMALVSSLKNHREDLKFIVNDILLNLTNLKGLFLGVNKHGKNGLSKRDQLKQLFAQDAAICVFPAGLVSRKINGKVMDLDWAKTFITLSKTEQRTIVPIFIDGQLSNFFYRLANFRKKMGIKANIEMLYLSNEFFKFRNKEIKIFVGTPIPYSDMPEDLSDRKKADWVKKKVYKLKNTTL